MHFPEEILLEILVRLPAKSLVRFRCVSKSWKTLLTSPSFIKTHLYHSVQLQSCHIILNYIDARFQKLAIRFPNRHDFSHLDPPPLENNPTNNFELVGSINGIVCLATSPIPRRAVLSRTFLWNPAINECLTLPEPRAILGSNFLVGFGFNPLSGHLDDFKVVNVKLCYESDGPFHWHRSSQVQLYSLRINLWKDLGNFFPSWIGSHMGNQVIFKQFICWFPSALYGHKTQEALVSFDVVKEEFLEIAKPNVLLDKNYVALLDGCVSLLASDPFEGYEVWVMKEFGNVESWTKLYTIEVLAKGIYFYRPLGFANASEVLFCRYFSMGRHRLNTPKYLRSYDIWRRKFNDQCFKVKIDSFYSTRLVIYDESLISLSNPTS